MCVEGHLLGDRKSTSRLHDYELLLANGWLARRKQGLKVFALVLLNCLWNLNS
jgi:hypothetical protein